MGINKNSILLKKITKVESAVSRLVLDGTGGLDEVYRRKTAFKTVIFLHISIGDSILNNYYRNIALLPIMRDIRRKEKEITSKDEIIKILKNTRYITIAICEENSPYLVTLNHGYDSKKDAIYFHCAKEGKKIDILRKNNVVWGQALIDKGYVLGTCDHLYATAQFMGKVTFIDDIVEKKHALETMIKQQEQSPERVIKKQITEESVKRVNIGRIDILYISGKKADKVIVT